MYTIADPSFPASTLHFFPRRLAVGISEHEQFVAHYVAIFLGIEFIAVETPREPTAVILVVTGVAPMRS